MKEVHKFSAQPVTILLVDDDEDCRTLIRDAMDQGKLDNPVYEVASGEEALAFLRREGIHANAPRPGLIYLDIEMPGMGGQETLRAIRKDPRFADIAVVMMTGVTDDNQKHLAMSNGANSYTNKPTDAMTFVYTVVQSTNYWLRIHQFPSVHEQQNVA
ncbi:MAG TPA: response regulator [Phycisphaerae bacterium]|nr:response regulator [Phycisphaerae bacterium]